MIEVKNKGKDYFIEINGRTFEGTNTNNHLWCFRKNMLCFGSDQDFDLYQNIKDLPVVLLPERIEFEFFQYDSQLLSPLERLPYPLNTFKFIKEDSLYTIGMSCYLEIDKWKRKWAASIYFDEIEKIIQDVQEFRIRKKPDSEIYDEGFEFFIETTVQGINTISEAFEKTLPKFTNLIEKVENNLSDIAGLLKIIDRWNENQDNDDEEFWQRFFISNSHIISQAFSTPAFIFKDKAYIGGKGIENTSGKIIDFVYKSKKTNNLFLIEIKTPVTKLISSKYRGTFSISLELSGAINQMLQYKDIQQKEFYTICTKSNKKYELFNPKCILVIGNLDSLGNNEKQAFELFRNDLKSIDILTFDELFGKIELLLELIKEKLNYGT